MKQQVTIWANCQGGVIYYMLNKYYGDNFEIRIYLNYEIIKNKELIPDFFIDTDIFIYQNYSDKPGSIYDLSNILNNILKKDCIKICIPFLQSDLLFPFDHNNLANQKTINEKFPHGKFFYGISIIEKFFNINDNLHLLDDNEKNIMIDQIIDKILDVNCIEPDNIKNYYDRNFDFFEKKILNSDVPELYNFIKNNFTNIRLFHNRNHPTGILLNQLIKLIFNLLKLSYDEKSECNIQFLEKSLKDWVVPILPSVRKHYNITYENIDDKCSSVWNKDIIDTRTYLKQYILDMYFDN